MEDPMRPADTEMTIGRGEERCPVAESVVRHIVAEGPPLKGWLMSLPHTSGAYSLGPDDGEVLWFNGALGLLRATADQTEGRFAAFELRPPKGFAAPLHSRKREDEFFLVLSGEVRLRHGDDVIEGVAGSFIYTPRDIGHSFHVDSDDARLLLFFGPAGGRSILP
jgi:quercetin dioxygenase-like cupin family protein